MTLDSKLPGLLARDFEEMLPLVRWITVRS
jgi:hypothetical protein